MRTPHILLRYKGETHTLKEWAKITGVPEVTIRGRYRSGWGVKDILETPKRQKKEKKKKEAKFSICWDCSRNANDCEWVRAYIPVKGWKAKKKKTVENNATEITTYHVYKCPKFRKSVKMRK